MARELRVIKNQQNYCTNLKNEYMKPKIWVKGSDYTGNINKGELRVAKSLGIDIHLYDSEINCSSTMIYMVLWLIIIKPLY